MLDAVLARGRAMAEARMRDTCRIRRPTGETTDADGNVVKTYGPNLYAGKCRFQQPNAQAAQADVGEDYLLLLRMEVHLPMSVVGLKAGDEVDAVGSATDPDLPGRVFVIRDLAHASDKTARRVGVTERTS
ncbi:DUF6093 family protein [Micromonospora sp. DPT]|uniref:DUF6093 family protein n=1 Tax=Micromonospora sp. DPT TaxID=3142975 RepID=UPI00320B0CEE